MRVLSRAVYRGPHIHGPLPMVRFVLDLEDLETYPTRELPGFPDALVTVLPGLNDHGCSRGRRGGFVERLHEGTWIGHVVEHVALELQHRAGLGVTRGKTRSVKGHRGVYNVMVAYRNEEVCLAACRLALELVANLLPAVDGKPVIVAGLDLITGPLPVSADDGTIPGWGALRALAARKILGPTTQSIVDEARTRGIPVERLDEHSLLRLGYGVNQELVRASITGRTSLIAVEQAGNKDTTKRLLADGQIPVPAGTVVQTVAEALAAAEEIVRKTGSRIVVKPLDGNHGRAVSVGLRTPEEITRAFALAQTVSRRVIVEQEFVGRDFRVLVIDGEVEAVAERIPAHVIADGERTIAQLVDVLNADERRGSGHEKAMTKIAMDDQLRDAIHRQGYTLLDIPECGTLVWLRETANLSTGGEAVDRTDEIHPENVRIAEHAARIIGLDVAGLDILTPDIAQPMTEVGGGIVEVNAAPGFRMHLNPSAGTRRNVARPFVNMLIPPWSRGRIPIVSVTGTNGKTTVAKMVNHVFTHLGQVVGHTTTSGIWIDGRLTRACDGSGPKSARTVLADPRVEVAILETARGGILREGLGYDRADVGIVLNISADHLGITGVDTLEELANVKEVVARYVWPRGLSVLNFDDPLTRRMARSAGGRVGFFTLTGADHLPQELDDHLADGGIVATTQRSDEGPVLIIVDGSDTHELLPAAAIPATIGGAARFNTANALAAALAAYALDVPPRRIAEALRTFESTFEQNPGRLNLTTVPGCTTILDYAHNPAALAALGDVLTRIRPAYRNLIGVVSIPGDRRDEDIREMGRLAAGLFDTVVFRERPDRRGRRVGSVVSLMAEGALAAGMDPLHIRRVLDEYQAIDVALMGAGPDDLVAIMPTNVADAWKHITTFAARHADVLGAGVPVETTAEAG